MALYHTHINYISRASTNSSYSHAAYICGEKATDLRTNTSFDYRNKAGEVAYKNILLPKGMEHLNSTEKLWNAIEVFEDKIADKRYGNYKDPIKQEKSLAAKEKYLNEASISYTLEHSLPKEMDLEEKKELSDRIAKEVFGSRNLIVQYAIHDIAGNPHVHYLANFRPIINGEFSNSKFRFSRKIIKTIRKQIADITNIYAKERGYDFSIDHRSYAEQGIRIEPTKHVGWWGSKIAENSRIILENREILSKNAALLLQSPEEVTKLLVQNKTVFTLEELKKEATKRFGSDHQTWHIVKELIEKKDVDSLIEKASYFGEFLEVAHKIRECFLANNVGDKNFIRDLRAERELMATKILDNIGDYKWLMSRVGISTGTIAAMANQKLFWNDRSVFVGHDLPVNLKGGDTLKSLEKSFGTKALDDGLIAAFNLEYLGSYFRGRDAYISQRDLRQEKDLVAAKERLEDRVIKVTSSLSARLFGKTPEKNIASIIKSQEREQGYKLSQQQKDAAISLVENNAYGALIGKAGTGKTTTLRVVAASYQKSGFRIIGTSFQGAAVGELGNSLGKYMDNGFTLHKLQKEWQSIDKGTSSQNRVERYELTERSIVIVDEAAMAPRYLLQSLLERAIEKGAKVIAVGDTVQISSIDRSDSGRLLLDGGNVLTEVRRQSKMEDVEASRYFAEGFIRNGLEIYQNKGHVKISETEFSSKLSLMHDVAGKVAKDDPFKHLIIAYKNSDVEDFNAGTQRVLGEDNKLGEKVTILTGFKSLNDEIRKNILANDTIKNALAEIRNYTLSFKKNSLSYKEADSLLKRLEAGSNEHKILTDILKPRDLYVGDKVRFTSNNNQGIEGKTIYNGSLGIIKSYDSKASSLIIGGDDGDDRQIDLTKYQGLDLGYAVTINRSQGKTVENSYVYLANSKSAKIGSKEFYVAATRHKGEVIFYSSSEYLQGKELYQKIGEQWKINAHDLKDNPDRINPDLDLVFKLEKTSNAAYSLWQEMQKDVRGGKCDLWHHEKFDKYKELKGELGELGSKAKDNWDKVRIYASEAGITLSDVETWIGSDDKNLKENEKLKAYRQHRQAAQELWRSILRLKSPDSSNPLKVKADLYNKFNEQSSLRNKLAYELASFGGKEKIYNRSGNLITSNRYNHTDKSEWKNILRHSNLYIKSQTRDNSRDTLKTNDLQHQWKSEHIQLQNAVKDRAESIAEKLLGNPNKKLSSRNELRFGDKGNISVSINSLKAGMWYDFSAGKGGDIFDLVREKHGCDFKEAASYLRQQVGMRDIDNARFRNYTFTTEPQIQDKEDQDLIAKKAKSEKLYTRSHKLEQNSIASRYLREHRSIYVSAGDDVKQTNVYISGKHYYVPALIAFARDREGNITGGQKILLDKQTSAKANVDIPKRSFGKISGSFVEVAQDKNSNVTVIAEGLETALSVKEAGVDGKIFSSLGISNIKNYSPDHGEKIIIAADNDGENSLTNRITLEAKKSLEEKGAYVEIVQPKQQGDFNDLLKDSSQGKRVVRDLFHASITKHNAKTLNEYFSTNNNTVNLTQDERNKIKYLSQFKINEEQIVNAYRIGHKTGYNELNSLTKSVSLTYKYIKSNMRTIDSANIYGANINPKNLLQPLLDQSMEDIDKHIILLREKYYIKDSLNDLMQERLKAKTPEQAYEALKSHQDFLAKLHNNHAPDIHGKRLEQEIKFAHHNQEHKIAEKLEKLTCHLTTTEMNQNKITSTLKSAGSSANALNALTKKYQGYVMHTIHSTIKDIKAGHIKTMGKKEFTSEEKFLEHILKTHKNNDFFPRQNVEKIYNNYTKQPELSMDFHKDINM